MVYYALFMYYQLSASPLDGFLKWWTKVWLPLKDSSMHMRRAVRNSSNLGDNVKATCPVMCVHVFILCVCACALSSLCVWCVEPFAAGDVVIAPRCRHPHLPQPSGNYLYIYRVLYIPKSKHNPHKQRHTN
jgi:hypothetical protein